MPITRNSARKSKIEEANYYKIDSSSEDFDFNSDDSEEDPNFEDELDKAQSKISKLSITNKPNSREHIDLEVDDGEVSDMEEISVPVLNKTDLKNFDQVQKLIDAGQIEKLKVEQCKVYLRKHGLRLTGKKEILIQRIKEHLEILNGGGEKKYPPSSFVLNCKGDACMGDIVMFEQTVYEGYNLASRSAIGPPCGKRIVAGRIVKESYGAAKQQHTFTVEVLWSKGEKALPSLHPLLIKGRNLYKSNTTRQRWQDEAERKRVLDEKHSRGSVARSNREARIQEKEARKMIKGNRAFSKVCQSSRPQKNIKHESEHITQQQHTSQEANPKFRAEFEGNSNQGMPRFPPNVANKPSIPIYKAQESYCPPSFQLSKSAESSYGSDCGYSKNCLTGNAQNSYPSKIGSPTFQHSKTVDLGSGSDCGYLKNFSAGNARKSYPSQIGSPTFQLSKPAESRFRSDYGYVKNSSTGNARTSYPSQIGSPTFQLGKPAESRLASHRGYLKNSFNGNAMCSDKYQQARDPRHQLSRENKENSFPKPYFSECRNIANYPQGNVTFSDKPLHSNREISYGRNHQRPSNTQRKICPYYPQGRCYYGNQCKFLHESNRNYC